MPSPKSEISQAVIMAAGLGTRLRPLTLDRPKPMVEVAGRPVLQRTIAALPPEITEVLIVVGHFKERIVAAFGDRSCGRRIRYVEQRELKGTGHALAICEPLLGERFLVMNGDDLYAAEDLATMRGHDLAILAFGMDSPSAFGSLAVNASGAFVGITEGASPAAKEYLVNTGVYALDRRFFSYPLAPIKNGAEFGLPQTMAAMAKDHAIDVVRASFWMPVGTPEQLAAATEAMRVRDGSGTV